MPREDMSLDEARQVIACWLESIDVGDLPDERFEAAISSNPRLNTAFDTVAASAVEQFSAQVQHGRMKLSYESRLLFRRQASDVDVLNGTVFAGARH